MFGSKQKRIAALEQVAGALQLQVDQLTAQLRAVGGLEHFQLRQEVDRMRAELVDLQHAHAAERLAHQQSLATDRRAHEDSLVLLQKDYE